MSTEKGTRLSPKSPIHPLTHHPNILTKEGEKDGGSSPKTPAPSLIPQASRGAEQSSLLWPHLHSLGTPYTKPPQVPLKIICLLRHMGQHDLDMLCSAQELRSASSALANDKGPNARVPETTVSCRALDAHTRLKASTPFSSGTRGCW